MSTVKGILFALTLTLFATILALFDVAYDGAYYHTFQMEHDIVSVSGKTQEELDQASEDTILYLQNGDFSLMQAHFGERAATHMADVYELFELARVVGVALAFGLALHLIWAARHDSKRSMKIAWVTQAVLWAGLVFLVYLGSTQWDLLFTRFHEVFFQNDLWLLDPSHELLIQMMPTPFFVGMAVEIAWKSVVCTLAVYLLWWWLGRNSVRTGRREQEA